MPPVEEAEVTEVTETVMVAETPKEEAKVEEAKVPTFAEVEKQWQDNFRKERGLKIEEPKPAEVKKEVVAEVKTEKKEGEVEEKTTIPIDKKITGISRVKHKLEMERQRSRMLEQQIEAMKAYTKPAESKTETKVETPTEPKREDYDTVEKWVEAIRQFDRDQSKQETAQRDADKEVQGQLNTFADRIKEAKKEYPDWDDRMSKVNVSLNPPVAGLLISMPDASIVYHYAVNQDEARRLNDMSEQSVAAVGKSDNPVGVIKHLTANPTLIDKLNNAGASRAEILIGRIEAEIEYKLQSENKGGTVKTDTEKRASSGADAKAIKAGAVATEVVKPAATKVPDRVRPEPPAKLAGTAPSPNTWTDPADMTFQQREALMREDLKFKRR